MKPQTRKILEKYEKKFRKKMVQAAIRALEIEENKIKSDAFLNILNTGFVINIQETKRNAIQKVKTGLKNIK